MSYPEILAMGIALLEIVLELGEEFRQLPGAFVQYTSRLCLKNAHLAGSIPRTLFPGGFAANPCMFEKGPNPVFFGHLLSFNLGAWDSRIWHVPATMLNGIEAKRPSLIETEEKHPCDASIADEVGRHAIPVEPTAFSAVPDEQDRDFKSSNYIHRMEERNDVSNSLECCGTLFKTEGAKRYAIPSISIKTHS
jgi:hypothetical protein